MDVIINVLVTLFKITSGLTFVASATFSGEVLFSLFARVPAKYLGVKKALRVAVLVPAHNESSYMLPTLRNCRAQLGVHDRLLVVADNCSDDTAEVARQAGAEVIERHDSRQQGKGYALQFGVDHLSADPPDVVVIVDADCHVEEGSIAELAVRAEVFGRPTQAMYLMLASCGYGPEQALSAFTWRLKNLVRPLGLSVLGGPCQLMGSGMAFPFSLIRRQTFATASVVEDLQLGIKLAREWKAPVFCPSAVVTSSFPVSAAGQASQRARWEAGHLITLVESGLPAMLEGLVRGNMALFALGLDCCVPPLSLLFLAAAFHLVVGGALGYVGLSSHVLALAFFSNVLCYSALIVCIRGNSESLSLRYLHEFALVKARAYGGIIRGGLSRTWGAHGAWPERLAAKVNC